MDLVLNSQAVKFEDKVTLLYILMFCIFFSPLFFFNISLIQSFMISEVSGTSTYILPIVLAIWFELRLTSVTPLPVS